MEKWDETVETSVEQFVRFTEFLHKENLMDKAIEHLKKQGLPRIRVSRAHITEVQKMIKEHFGGNPTGEARIIANSIHN